MLKQILTKLFNLFGKCYHCWHLNNSGDCRKKIRNNTYSDCNIDKERNPFINSKGNVTYVMIEYCCKCSKARLLWCEDYSVGRGLNYPEYAVPDDGFRYNN